MKVVRLLIGFFLISIKIFGQEDLVKLYNQAVDSTNNKNFAAAIKLYKYVLSVDPTFHQAYYSLGYTFELQNKYQDAIDNYSNAISIKKLTRYYFRRAIAYGKVESDVKALWDYNKVLKLEPENTYAIYYKAQILQRLKRDNEAIYNYKKALSLGLHEPNIYEELAQLYSDRSQTDSTIYFYELYIKENTNDEIACISLAKIYENKGELNKAMSLYDSTIKMSPDFGYAYYLRGILKENFRINEESGCNDLKTALKLGYKEANVAITKFCK